MRLLPAAAVLFAPVAPRPDAPPTLDTSDGETSAQQRKPSSGEAAELLELYEGWSENEASDEEPPPIVATSPVGVCDGRVLIDCATEGDPKALAAALTALGQTDVAVFKRLVSGWLPMAPIGQIGELEELRLARSGRAEMHGTRNVDPSSEVAG